MDYYSQPDATAEAFAVVADKPKTRRGTKGNRKAQARRYRKRKAAKLRKYMRSYQAERRNKLSGVANRMVCNAIATGRMKRQPCKYCGAPNAQAHHDDYSKPLEVKWMCKKHHTAWHMINKPLHGNEPAMKAA